MLSDIEIAQRAHLESIVEVARKLGIPEEILETHGRVKAKIPLDYLASLQTRPDGKLILVTAMSPTPAGEGKTTTTVGLGDALNRIGKRAVICLREPSLGPVFGLKGGAAGGGYAQIVPMEDINLHFTGDFNAVALAHNLLAALIDNHIYFGNALDVDPQCVTWKRVMDMNDRALREITIGCGGRTNGIERKDGFDIVVASEVMAILCLATSFEELKDRLSRIVIGKTRCGMPVLARDLKAHGAMTALLREAIKPNLVQTLENNPAFVHGGPFANIAHGCSSLLATRLALKLADYVVTEAGFGADLGAEKFIDIKCRKGGLVPATVVVVATLRALKFHGGIDVKQLKMADVTAVKRGMDNLQRHIANIRNRFGLSCVVAINHFETDTREELEVVETGLASLNVPVVSATHWANGGVGAEALARTVVSLSEQATQTFRFAYDSDLPLWDKLVTVATTIYGASSVVGSDAVRARVAELQAGGYGHYPVCVAKTQYSFSSDPKVRGAPDDHVLTVREVRLAAGAEFIVFICGDLMTMPGLPREPAAQRIDVDANGRIIGLS